MAYFPLFIDITGRKCLVIGGGRVAMRKVETLLAYGADVRIISPEICQEILQMLSGSEEVRMPSEPADPEMDKMPSGIEISRSGGRLHASVEDKIIRGTLTSGELEEEIAGAALVVAASGSREANHQAAVICHRLGIPVNVVDQPSECTFLFPAVVKKGEISIGINTGGLSPIVSSVIRQETEENIPDYYAEIAWQLGRLRSRIKREIPEEKLRRHYLKKLAGMAFSERRALSEGEIEAVLGQTARR